MSEPNSESAEVTQDPEAKIHYYRHLTRRDKFMRRVVAPLAIGATLTTAGLLIAKEVNSSDTGSPKEALEMVLEDGEQIVAIIPEVTILNGAHFRNKSSTKDSLYQDYFDHSEINGIPIKDTKGIVIYNATLVSGYNPEGKGTGYWIKCEAKNFFGGKHIDYISMSEQTRDVVIPRDVEEIMKVTEDASGFLSANNNDRVIQEHQFNQTVPIPKQVK